MYCTNAQCYSVKTFWTWVQKVKTLPPFYLVKVKVTLLKLAYAYILHLHTQTEYQIQVLQINSKPFHTHKKNLLTHITHVFLLLFCIQLEEQWLKQVLRVLLPITSTLPGYLEKVIQSLFHFQQALLESIFIYSCCETEKGKLKNVPKAFIYLNCSTLHYFLLKKIMLYINCLDDTLPPTTTVNSKVYQLASALKRCIRTQSPLSQNSQECLIYVAKVST